MFQTLGTPMRAGREFAASNITDGSTVAVINEACARALWPGVPIPAIIGRPLETVAGPRTVIGVAGDIRTLPSNAAVPGVFLPVTTPQMKALGFKVPIVVRMHAGAVPDLELLTTRLRERFPTQSVRLVSLGEQLGTVLDRPRFLAVLFGVLAGVALLLAATGVYAVAAFESVTRRHEMAIRQALGATAARLRGRLGADILAPVLVGTSMGLTASWLGARAFQAQVAELDAVNPSVFLAALLLIVVATVIALWRPAIQTGKVDPATELRSGR
jgi:hypothetical protein